MLCCKKKKKEKKRVMLLERWVVVLGDMVMRKGWSTVSMFTIFVALSPRMRFLGARQFYNRPRHQDPLIT